MNIRVGSGYDVHRLREGESLILGGVNIPHHKGTVAHSDGDVLVHAICDALLGAANLRDIGFHFSDTSPEFKNMDSGLLLKRTIRLMQKQNYEIGNVDTTICLQSPKLIDHIPKMKKELARTMMIDIDFISVKATTTERLGFVGEEAGISAYATVLIHKVNA
jgi:2-C-methyl-D-erythritol 2,4-cyclodiphosphate synthase